MLLPAEIELAHLGETASRADHDLIHELSRRLDSLPRYDQYISNAQQHEVLRQFWCNMKSQEVQTIQLLKELLAEEMRNVAL